MTSPPPNAAAGCIEQTRSAVLNVLIVTGTGIAVSGFLLRWRDLWALSRAPTWVGQGLMIGLLVVAVASFAVRRVVSGSGALRDPARFRRGHVLSAALASLGVPLGLAYGWFVRPRLDVVGPFWVIALTLGFLALPRAHRQNLDTEETGPGTSNNFP